MRSAKAAVFHGANTALTLAELPVPSPQGAEVLVRVSGCTLCGSDLHTFDGRRSVPVPTILGHEIVGEILELGPSAARQDMAGQPLRVGDGITWAVVASCGACFFCRHGLPQKCSCGVKYGHESLKPGRELLGGLAQACLLVPGTAILRIPEPELLPLSVVCPASCATATVSAALEAVGNLAGSRVCVLGAGMLGLTACAMASTRGAIVCCIEPSTVRRELAMEFGAQYAVVADDIADVVNRVTDDIGFDAVLEFSGSPAAFASGWSVLRMGGTLVLVGSVFPSPPCPLSLDQIVRRNITIRGIHNYAPWHLRDAVDFLIQQHRRFPFARLVSKWISLSELAQELIQRHDDPPIRVGVDPWLSA